jgi:hypothetical protein
MTEHLLNKEGLRAFSTVRLTKEEGRSGKTWVRSCVSSFAADDACRRPPENAGTETDSVTRSALDVHLPFGSTTQRGRHTTRSTSSSRRGLTHHREDREEQAADE